MPHLIDYSRIAAQVKDARKKAGLTQAKLAEICGYSTSYIANIETNKVKLSLPVLVTLCVELKLDIAELLDLKAEDSMDMAGEAAILIRRLSRVIASASPRHIHALNLFLVEECRLYLESLVGAEI